MATIHPEITVPAETDRFTVNVPAVIGDALERWAESEGRKKASLAAFLIELAVRQKYPDEFPPSAFPKSLDELEGNK